jgi:hypothetical protein
LGDGGFPVVVRDLDARREREREREREGSGKERERERDRERGALRVVGYLGINELEHALCECPRLQVERERRLLGLGIDG